MFSALSITSARDKPLNQLPRVICIRVLKELGDISVFLMSGFFLKPSISDGLSVNMEQYLLCSNIQNWQIDLGSMFVTLEKFQ